VEDFWTLDVAGLYASLPVILDRPLFELRWTRWDEAAPDVRGLEWLRLRLEEPADGKTYALPGPGATAEYSMATPSKGEGAQAVALEGTVRVVKQTPSGALLAIDLAARMARTDLIGEFRESVRGTYWLPSR